MANRVNIIDVGCRCSRTHDPAASLFLLCVLLLVFLLLLVAGAAAAAAPATAEASNGDGVESGKRAMDRGPLPLVGRGGQTGVSLGEGGGHALPQAGVYEEGAVGGVGADGREGAVSLVAALAVEFLEGDVAVILLEEPVPHFEDVGRSVYDSLCVCVCVCVYSVRWAGVEFV